MSFKRAKIGLWALFCSLCLLTPGHANASIDTKICAQAIEAEENASKIPKNVLKAISHVESGRYLKSEKAFFSWPWTVNSQGKGYFFDTKEQAVNFVKSLQRGGVKSIDVGCMQINLHHHKDAFDSVEEAFDPKTNVAYAADFLQALYNEKKSWTAAIGRYHSATPMFSEPYKRKVLNRMQAINGGGAVKQDVASADPAPAKSKTVIVRGGETTSVRYTKLTIFELDAKRKKAVMAAWQERKRSQANKRQRLASAQ